MTGQYSANLTSEASQRLSPFYALYLVLLVSVVGAEDESNLKKRKKDEVLDLTGL
jgi:hypothetical protein